MKLTGTIINNYIIYCEKTKNLDWKTLKAYRTDLRQFEGYLTGKGADFQREAVVGYIARLNGTCKPRTVKRKRASIRALTTWLLHEGLIDGNPFENLRFQTREPSYLPKVIPFWAVERMLQAAHSEITLYPGSERALCEAAVLELLFATGVRVSELCGIKAGDLDLKDGALRILGKGKKERIVFIEHESVLSALRQYGEQRAPGRDEPFFRNRRGHALSTDSVRDIVWKYGKLSGWTERVTPHMLRHTLATGLLENEVDIRYIQQLLGHSLITTTQLYTHVAGGKQREIMRYQHPRNKMLLQPQDESGLGKG